MQSVLSETTAGLETPSSTAFEIATIYANAPYRFLTQRVHDQRGKMERQRLISPSYAADKVSPASEEWPRRRTSRFWQISGRPDNNTMVTRG